MQLFGDTSGQHMAHFQARREADFVELGWEIRNGPVLRWRILRSDRGFAAAAEALEGSDQTVVMEGTDTYLRDDEVVEGTPYFYTVFAQDDQGVWHRQVETRLTRGERLRWLNPSLKRWTDEAATGYRAAGALSGEPDGTLLLTSNPPVTWSGGRPN
jgi:hypothetical protein